MASPITLKELNTTDVPMTRLREEATAKKLLPDVPARRKATLKAHIRADLLLNAGTTLKAFETKTVTEVDLRRRAVAMGVVDEAHADQVAKPALKKLVREYLRTYGAMTLEELGHNGGEAVTIERLAEQAEAMGLVQDASQMVREELMTLMRQHLEANSPITLADLNMSDVSVERLRHEVKAKKLAAGNVDALDKVALKALVRKHLQETVTKIQKELGTMDVNLAVLRELAETVGAVVDAKGEGKICLKKTLRAYLKANGPLTLEELEEGDVAIERLREQAEAMGLLKDAAALGKRELKNSMTAHLSSSAATQTTKQVGLAR